MFAPGLLAALALTAGAERAARPASVPAGRIAVVMLPATPSDSGLADNLTEVVIARLAELGAAEIVGTPELLRRMKLTDERAAHTCLDQPACVDRVAVSLGVQLMLTGNVDARSANKFVFNLALRDVQRAQIQRRVFDTVDGPVQALVRRMQEATEELIRPAPPEARLQVEPLGVKAEASVDRRYAGTAPLTLRGIAPGRHLVTLDAAGRFPWATYVDVEAGRTAVVKVNDTDLKRPLRWPRYAAFGTGGAAALSLAGGAVVGSIALFSPVGGSNRADAQRQFEDRRTLGTAADVMLIGGAALAAASAILFIVYRDHIFFR